MKYKQKMYKKSNRGDDKIVTSHTIFTSCVKEKTMDKFFLSDKTKELFKQVFILRKYLTADIDTGGELINLLESGIWAVEIPDNKFTGKDFRACRWLKFGDIAINFWELKMRANSGERWDIVDCGWSGGDIAKAIQSERDCFENWRSEFLKNIPEIKSEIINDKYIVPVIVDEKKYICPKCNKVLSKVCTRNPSRVYWWGDDEAYGFNYGFFCQNCNFESTVEVDPYDDKYKTKEQFWESLEGKLLTKK